VDGAEQWAATIDAAARDRRRWHGHAERQRKQNEHDEQA